MNYHNVSQGSSQDLKLWQLPFYWCTFQIWIVMPGAEEIPRNSFQHSWVSCHVYDLLLYSEVDSEEALHHLLPATEDITHIWVSHQLYFCKAPWFSIILNQFCLVPWPPLERNLILHSMHTHVFELGFKDTMHFKLFSSQTEHSKRLLRIEHVHNSEWRTLGLLLGQEW